MLLKQVMNPYTTNTNMKRMTPTPTTGSTVIYNNNNNNTNTSSSGRSSTGSNSVRVQNRHHQFSLLSSDGDDERNTTSTATAAAAAASTIPHIGGSSTSTMHVNSTTADRSSDPNHHHHYHRINTTDHIHNDNIAAAAATTTTDTIDDMILQFETYVQETGMIHPTGDTTTSVSMHHQQQQQNIQSLLHQILNHCSNHTMDDLTQATASIDYGNNSRATTAWNVSRVTRFMTHCILPIVDHYVTVCQQQQQQKISTVGAPQQQQHHSTDVTHAEEILRLVYTTLSTLMDANRNNNSCGIVWNTHLTYIAMSVSIRSSPTNTIDDDDDDNKSHSNEEYDDTTLRNGTGHSDTDDHVSVVSLLYQTLQYIDIQYETRKNNCAQQTTSDEPNGPIVVVPPPLTMDVVILYSHIWTVFQSIHDHCIIPSSTTNTTFSNVRMSPTTASWWWRMNDCNVVVGRDNNDNIIMMTILLRIVSVGIATSDSSTTTRRTTTTSKWQDDTNNDIYTNQQQFVASCANVMSQIVQQQLTNHSWPGIDCITATTTTHLRIDNGLIISIIYQVRNYIQHHHLSSTGTTKQTYENNLLSFDNQKQIRYEDMGDSYISFRYIQVLVTIVVQLKHNSNTNIIIHNSSDIVNDIRQLILVNHTFIQYLIRTMLHCDTIATNTETLHRGGTAIGVNVVCGQLPRRQHRQQRQLALSIVKTLYEIIPETIDTILTSQLRTSLDTTKNECPSCQENQDFVHSYVQRTIHALATNKRSDDRDVLDHTMECLLFLHAVQRTKTRQVIMSYLNYSGPNSSHDNRLNNFPTTMCHILQQLLWYIQVGHSLPTASFLEQLLMDATDTLRHDALSRRIWFTIHKQQQNSIDISSSSDEQVSMNIGVNLWHTLSTFLMQHEHDTNSISCPTPYPPVLIKLCDIAYHVVRNSIKTEQQCRLSNPQSEPTIVTTTLIESLLRIVVSDTTHCKASGVVTVKDVVFAPNEDDTPTVQNLSRCWDGGNTTSDDLNICGRRTMDWSPLASIDVPEEKCSNQLCAARAISTGEIYLLPLEQSVLLSTAALLTTLAGESNYWDSEMLFRHDGVFIRERIIDAVNTYVVQMQFTSSLISVASCRTTIEASDVRSLSLYSVSPDMTRRRLRLIMELAHQSDSEESLSAIVHISEQTHQNQVVNLQKQLDRCRLQVKAYQEQEQHLLLENESYANLLSSQSDQHQYEKHEIHRKITQRAKQMVAVHNSERQQMEHQMQGLSLTVHESQHALQVCRQSEQNIQSILQETTVKLKECQVREKESSVRIDYMEGKMHRASDELTNITAQLQISTKKIQFLEDEFRHQVKQTEEIEHREADVKNCLENLFGDMVKLARLYVVKENEVNASNEKYSLKLKELQRCLISQRERNDQFDKQGRQKQYDFDLLQKKYQRLKEKIEQERQESQRKLEDEKQRSKRNGPISYMNQLHLNASSLHVSTGPDRAKIGKGAAGNATDKENATSSHGTSTTARRDLSFR